MEEANQVRKQGLPDTKLKLMHEVDNHHSGNIEFFSKPMKEGVLFHIWLGVAINNNDAHSRQLAPKMST